MRSHRVVDKGSSVQVLLYIDGVQVGVAAFPEFSDGRHDWDEYMLAANLGAAWDSMK